MFKSKKHNLYYNRQKEEGSGTLLFLFCLNLFVKEFENKVKIRQQKNIDTIPNLYFNIIKGNDRKEIIKRR